MQKNVASQKIGAQMVSATDGSNFTGSVTVYVTGDAGTQAIGSVGSGVCTHEGNGYHTYAPAQAETNYDLCAFTFIGTGAISQTLQIYTQHDANLKSILGTVLTETAGYLAAGFKKFFNIATPAATMDHGILVDTVTTTTTATNLTNAPTSGDLTATMKTSVQTAATASIVAFFGADAATFIASIWNALTSGMSTVGSIGKKLADWVVGTIDTYTGNTKQTGDAYARLGAPAGASIAADIAATPAAVWAVVVHTGITALQAMRMFGAMLAGKTAGAGTGTVTFRNPIDTLDAMIISMTGSNRTATTKDLSA